MEDKYLEKLTRIEVLVEGLITKVDEHQKGLALHQENDTKEFGKLHKLLIAGIIVMVGGGTGISVVDLFKV
ncbi:MAG TPA: hypothetical protein VFO37_02325 [Chitinophagaceae bacterium]|nr:hypothetical protein [Chitinophagaceae bacterium]